MSCEPFSASTGTRSRRSVGAGSCAANQRTHGSHSVREALLASASRSASLPRCGSGSAESGASTSARASRATPALSVARIAA